MLKTDHKIVVNASSRIGFFDSGIGGLTILKQFLPCNAAKYMYVADTAHMPYGDRSRQEIQTYSEAIVRFLLNNECDQIIIACHTATALAFEHVQTVFKNARIIGVVEGVVHEALATTKTKRIGIIATAATIASGYHEQQLKNYDPEVQVFPVPCPLLASAIEFGTHRGEALHTLIKGYLQSFEHTNIDTLILGSTHYDIIKDTIRRLVSPAVTIISASDVMQKVLNNVAPNNEIVSSLSWYVTGNKHLFLTSAKKILSLPEQNLSSLTIESPIQGAVAS
jgi:glutamate racemase